MRTPIMLRFREPGDGLAPVPGWKPVSFPKYPDQPWIEALVPAE